MKGFQQVCIKELMEYGFRPYNFLKILVVAVLIVVIIAELRVGREQLTVNIGAETEHLFGVYEAQLERLQSMANLQLHRTNNVGSNISRYFTERHADIVVLLRDDKPQVFYRAYLVQDKYKLKRIAQTLALTLDHGPIPVYLYKGENYKDFDKSLSKVVDHYSNDTSVDLAMILKINLLFSVFIAFALNAVSLPKEREEGTLFFLLTAKDVTWRAICLGKTFAACIVAIITFVVVWVVSVVFYSVPIGGNHLTVALTVLLGVSSSAFFGFFISTLVNNQLQAYMACVLYFLCLLLLGDFSYPITTLSSYSKTVAYLLPLSFMVKPLCTSSFYGANEYGYFVVPLFAQCLLYGYLCKWGVTRYKRFI